MNELTPVERLDGWLVKRDDLCVFAGVCGAKLRGAWSLMKSAKGVTTATGRDSPQMQIVARLAEHLDVPCRLHVAASSKEQPRMMKDSILHGAELVEHRPGYTSVVCARAKEDAVRRGWRYVPYGMECSAGVFGTSKQVANVPKDIKRIVIPVGGGASVSGVLRGLRDYHFNVPVLGIQVGGDPVPRIRRWAGANWANVLTLQAAGVDYAKPVDAVIGGVRLDPYYEAKCVKFLKRGDLLWVVGIRAGIENE